MSKNLSKLNALIEQMAINEGSSSSMIEGVGVYRSAKSPKCAPHFYEPLICLVSSGEKLCHVGESTFRYQAGDFFINFLPMPVSTEVTSNEILSATLNINLVKLADMVLRIEREEEAHPDVARAEKSHSTSCVVVGKASEVLTDTFIKLLTVSNHPLEAAILGESIVDEIYYRILTSEHGYALRILLNQYGQIQPISKAVNFIHNNMDRTIQIHELANIANMSKTSFFNAFKNLMHVPPMQYVKSTKLQKAQALLKQGMQANEASFHVGYNSFSQFSREYKRFFGFPPSHTH
ncbi:AraC family transcriptional regulator [Marinibactrum halimedae]|uniref:AraC family transcriptional regulator n=1 Tax=Marinibactrum halimedae TaxID=1444977 RepID=A0AA37TCC6_9GAMM|nr:AraC family transcriptional regulator [Marinibactrum halimedae]MCD9458571.1 AraC family transcriptional regulator [Marinibactrum halimedae]GLS26562.1 AraC family transcriptional regulator [Marinibactrum halimedae]